MGKMSREKPLQSEKILAANDVLRLVRGYDKMSTEVRLTMEQESVLSLLMEAGEGYISGEAMSQRLGITRAAVWKQIAKLRREAM